VLSTLLIMLVLAAERFYSAKRSHVEGEQM
jgi:hypothetical protein